MKRLPWASAAVTLVILVATMTPGSAVPKVGFDGADVVVHVVAFAAWGLVVSRELSVGPGLVWVAGMVLALCTELLQMLVPGRTFAMWDLVSDAVGLAAGAALAAWLTRRKGQDSSANRARAAGESHASAD